MLNGGQIVWNAVFAFFHKLQPLAFSLWIDATAAPAHTAVQPKHSGLP
jgi:hypothetical protein